MFTILWLCMCVELDEGSISLPFIQVIFVTGPLVVTQVRVRVMYEKFDANGIPVVKNS